MFGCQLMCCKFFTADRVRSQRFTAIRIWFIYLFLYIQLMRISCFSHPNCFAISYWPRLSITAWSETKCRDCTFNNQIILSPTAAGQSMWDGSKGFMYNKKNQHLVSVGPLKALTQGMGFYHRIGDYWFLQAVLWWRLPQFGCDAVAHFEVIGIQYSLQYVDVTDPIRSLESLVTQYIHTYFNQCTGGGACPLSVTVSIGMSYWKPHRNSVSPYILWHFITACIDLEWKQTYSTYEYIITHIFPSQTYIM